MTTATVRFVCSSCNHTATLVEIEHKRREAAQRVSEGSGIPIDVSPIEVTDVLRCAACDGMMFAQAEESEEWKEEVKRRFVEMVMKEPRMKRVDAERLWSSISQSSTFFSTPLPLQKRKIYALIEELHLPSEIKIAGAIPTESEILSIINERMRKKFTELFRKDPQNKKIEIEPEKIWDVFEKSIQLCTK